MAITSYRDLDVWQISMDLVDLVFAQTLNMPTVEFDLRRQIRRAVVSIPSNLAEGWRRKGRRQAYQTMSQSRWVPTVSWRPNSRCVSETAF